MAYKNMSKNKIRSKRHKYFRFLKKKHIKAKNKYFAGHPISFFIYWLRSKLKFLNIFSYGKGKQ